jgi:hypothetical protein
MSRITMARQLRPLAFSLVLGLGAATGLAAAAHADGQTYSYETDVWPRIEAQRAAQAPMQQAQVQSPVTTSDAFSGSSVASQQNAANTAAVNGLGERVDHAGIPLVQDRGFEN